MCTHGPDGAALVPTQPQWNRPRARRCCGAVLVRGLGRAVLVLDPDGVVLVGGPDGGRPRIIGDLEKLQLLSAARKTDLVHRLAKL